MGNNNVNENQIADQISLRIELEESRLREQNLNTLEEFLSKVDEQSINVEFYGMHFYKLEWSYSKDCKKILITDMYDELFGMTEINIEDIEFIGYEMFSEKNVLEISFYNSNPMIISVGA